VHARSALFDLYGDHLRTRGGQAPVAALVRLMSALGIAAPAVRTAVSRMVRQGWLTPVALDQGPGYALTPKGVHRLEDAGERVYRSSDLGWDGRWHLLVTSRPTSRTTRERLAAQLPFLGYAQVADRMWVAPRPHPDADGLILAEGLRVQRFTAVHEGPESGVGSITDMVTRAWDLDSLGEAYEQWLTEAAHLLAEAPTDDEAAFARRSELVHGWRKFLFRDPGLPRLLLPDDWPGTEAADYFAVESARLLPAAARHVDACLSPR
jgi:phenylacetic acid degradation operon negative regulatory protein